MKSAPQDSGWVFDLTGGRLSLDFANTLGGERLTRPVERLNHYADLVSFSRQVGTATPERARRLLEQSARHPKKAALVLERARALREAIYRLWVAQIRKEPPAKSDMDLLNSVLTESLGQQRLVKEDDRFNLRWSDEDALESVLWPVAKSTADLLTSEEAHLVRVCESFSMTGCAWLFIDETRNRSRRWCSMSSCGNRAKARRHYQRTRHSRGPSNHG
jgi:predicted RNA-binding Zn ribbon-like protein